MFQDVCSAGACSSRLYHAAQVESVWKTICSTEYKVNTLPTGCTLGFRRFYRLSKRQLRLQITGYEGRAQASVLVSPQALLQKLATFHTIAMSRMQMIMNDDQLHWS